MMKWFDEIVHGFYSRRFYYDLVHDRKDIGLRYILILTVLTTLLMPLYYWQGYTALHPVISQIPANVGNLPDIIYENGTVSLERSGPFRMNFGSDTAPVWVMVDPKYQIIDTGTLAKVLRQGNVVILLTSTQLMVMRDAEGNLEMNELKWWYPSFFIGYKKWKILGDVIASRGFSIYTPLLILAAFVGIFIYNCVMTVFTACIAKIISWILRASFTMKSALRIAAMLRIPVTIITGAPVVMSYFVSDNMTSLVWFGYVIFAVYSARDTAWH